MKDKYYHTKESVEEYIELARDVDSRGLIEKFKLCRPPINWTDLVFQFSNKS